MFLWSILVLHQSLPKTCHCIPSIYGRQKVNCASVGMPFVINPAQHLDVDVYVTPEDLTWIRLTLKAYKLEEYFSIDRCM